MPFHRITIAPFFFSFPVVCKFKRCVVFFQCLISFLLLRKFDNIAKIIIIIVIVTVNIIHLNMLSQLQRIVVDHFCCVLSFEKKAAVWITKECTSSHNNCVFITDSLLCKADLILSKKYHVLFFSYFILLTISVPKFLIIYRRAWKKLNLF